jgi:hypothetical protein
MSKNVPAQGSRYLATPYHNAGGYSLPSAAIPRYVPFCLYTMTALAGVSFGSLSALLARLRFAVFRLSAIGEYVKIF